MSGLLAGVTVLSLEQATTLPYLTYRLACDGARVIRVENAERPDPNRFVGHDVLGEPAMRSYFLPNNCGKEAITLNLGDPEGSSSGCGSTSSRATSDRAATPGSASSRRS